MDTKKFVTMAVGIIVAVVLVAGLMVPVISSLSSDNGGEDRPEYINTGQVYFKPVGSETITFTIGSSTDEDFGTTLITLSINDGEPITIGPEWVSESSFDSLFYPLLTFTQNGKMGVEGILFNGLFGNMDSEYFESFGGAGYLRIIEGEEQFNYYYMFDEEYSSSPTRTIQITNGVVTYDFTDSIDAKYNLVLSDSEVGATSVLATGNAKVYSDDPTIFFGCVGNPTVEDEPGTGGKIVVDPSLLAFDFDITNAGTDARIYGGGSDSAVLEIDSSESDGLYTYSGATINGEGLNGRVIVPITVGGSSGEGSGLSPTLTTLLSVIPLITVVGIVIGMIGYLRFKE